jgi:hypothetical protein
MCAKEAASWLRGNARPADSYPPLQETRMSADRGAAKPQASEAADDSKHGLTATLTEYLRLSQATLLLSNHSYNYTIFLSRSARFLG